jgi:hypothetical protein
MTHWIGTIRFKAYSQASYFQNISAEDCSALITHASHPYSEIGRSLDGRTSVSYSKCKSSLIGLAKRLTNRRELDAEEIDRDKKTIEAQNQ